MSEQLSRKMECPICKKKAVFVGVHDDEGNYHGLMGCEYENAPWSGLSYALHHEGWGDCPLCTDDAESTMGGMLFDTAEESISALSPPNEWVNRVRELDELYTKLQIITGFTVEQLLEMFAAGYTLEKPDYSKSFEEMASLAETTPPNEPLTLEELREMDEPVWVACKPIEGGNGYWCLCQHGHIITPAGSIYDVKEIPHWVFYHRPLEGAEDGNV
ncbi:hypothetical protein [Dysosmobacter welbionis]